MSSDSSHDSGYKLLFSHAQVVEDLLRGFVPEDWVAELDFTTLEKVSGSYVSDDLRDREDDIIWRVLSPGSMALCLRAARIPEHRRPLDGAARHGLHRPALSGSDQDRGGPQGAKAAARFPAGPLQRPPALELRPVTSANSSTCCRAASSAIIRRIATFCSTKAPSAKTHLADRQNTVTSIIRLETSAVPADVRQAVSQLQQRLQGPQYASLRRAFVVWINRIVLRRLMPGQEVPEVNELQEIDTMLAETVEEWTRQWKADGLQQGLLQGLQEGRQKGLQEGRQEGLQEKAGARTGGRFRARTPAR
jgi:hypothetical protein